MRSPTNGVDVGRERRTVLSAELTSACPPKLQSPELAQPALTVPFWQPWLQKCQRSPTPSGALSMS